MELIKNIKNAEAQGKELIEKAKADAVSEAQQLRQRQDEALEAARLQRRQAVETAEAEAEAQGQLEVEKLEQQAEELKNNLRNTAAGKKDSAVNEITSQVSEL